MQTYTYQIREDGVDVVLICNSVFIMENCLLFVSSKLGEAK